MKDGPEDRDWNRIPTPNDFLETDPEFREKFYKERIRLLEECHYRQVEQFKRLTERVELLERKLAQSV